jgi:hypothetical protein
LFDGPWATDKAALAGRPTIDPNEAAPSRSLALAWDRVSAPIASLARLRPHSVACGPQLERKRDAIAAYRSQVTNLTGEDSWGYLQDNFVSLFTQPQELFFPLRT